MEHSEAVEAMAVERYLLDELTPDERETFEEHVFDCSECAMDLRTAAAFVDEARVQLPAMVAAELRTPVRSAKVAKAPWWKTLFATPMVMGPVFAALLVMVGYQNLVVVPALKTEAREPRMMPLVGLHGGARGAAQVIALDPKAGAALAVDFPEQTGYSSFAFDLFDPAGKAAWSHSVLAARDEANSGTSDALGAGQLMLQIPAEGLREGAYTLAVSGVDAQGQRTPLEKSGFEIQLKK